MSVIYIVLPLAMIVAVGAVYLFIVSVRGGQFDDMETPAMRILFDDERGLVKKENPDAKKTDEKSEEQELPTP
jgi:cbb3-type cytochrome oxidase maturation protein